MAIVVQLLNSNAYSGAEKIAIEIIKNDKENRNIYVARNGKIKDVLEREGVEHFLYDEIGQLKDYMKNLNPDVIHSHDYKASITSCMLKCKKRISHIHHNSQASKKINLKTIGYLMSSIFYSRIVYVSRVTMEEFIFYKLLKGKSFVISNWINIDERTWKDNVEKDIDILYIGRFEEEKNPLEVIDIVKRLIRDKSDISVAMVGDGTQKDNVLDEIEKNNLSNNIKIYPFTDIPHYYMKRSKTLIVPSKWEGFGLVLLEGMLNGTIVFASPVGGMIDIIEDKRNGFFLNENSDQIILDVINDYSRYDYIYKESIKTLGRYNINENTGEIYKMYKSIV